MWHKIAREAGVTEVPLHGLRHSAVSAMRRAGVPDSVVARWAGHDESTMRRTYTHVEPGELSAAAEVLGRIGAARP